MLSWLLLPRSVHKDDPIDVSSWALCWWIKWRFHLYFKGGAPEHWESGRPAKSVLMPACFLESKSKTCFLGESFLTLQHRCSNVGHNNRLFSSSTALSSCPVPLCTRVQHTPVKQIVEDSPGPSKISKGIKRHIRTRYFCMPLPFIISIKYII